MTAIPRLAGSTAFKNFFRILMRCINLLRFEEFNRKVWNLFVGSNLFGMGYSQVRAKLAVNRVICPLPAKGLQADFVKIC